MSFHLNHHEHDLVKRDGSVVVLRDFREITRAKRRKSNAVIVAFVHGIDEVLEIRFRRVFAPTANEANSVDSIANNVIEKHLCFENCVGRIERLTHGDDIVDRVYFAFVVNKVEEVIQANVIAVVA